MPAAQTKAELIAGCEAEFAKLMTRIEGIDAEAADAPRGDEATVRSVIGHRAFWIDLWLDWQDAGQTGRAVFMPAEGYGWNDIKALNRDIRQRQSDLTWHETKTLLADRHAAFMAKLAVLSEEFLYGQPMPGGNGRWTAGRYAQSAGLSHYRSAAKLIGRWLRD